MLCIIEENRGNNLASIASSSPLVGGWSKQHIKFIIYELFCTLKYLHSANIVHRDIKPSNILLNSTPTLTLIDYGLSRQISTDYFQDTLPNLNNDTEIRPGIQEIDQLTPLVVTRNYRAPELSLRQGKYNGAIDVFSVGCVFYELLQTLQPHPINVRRIRIDPLFLSRCDSFLERSNVNIDDILTSSNEHLYQIVSKVGLPSEEDLNFIQEEHIKEVLLIYLVFQKN